MRVCGASDDLALGGAYRLRAVNAPLYPTSTHVRQNEQLEDRIELLATVCRDICADCERECKKHADHHAACKACADSCAACIKECYKLGA